MEKETQIFFIILGGIIGITLLIRWLVSSRRERRAKQRRDDLLEAGLEIPPTLHPVFDPTLCIGSSSCTRACPQGNNVIGMIHNRGALLDPTQCIGHGRCAAECPVDAIRLVFGTAERGVDIPHLSSTFETNVAGIYISGELGGMGLIRNAVRQAAEGMSNLAKSLRDEKKRPASTDQGNLVDVAIIGAGPAGFTSALTAISQHLSYRFLESEPTVGGSVLHYPRRKIVHSETVSVPLLGKIHAKIMTKEDLLDLWHRAIQNFGVRLESGMKVEKITKQPDGLFLVETGPEKILARRVMLAIGRRGTPKKMGVPGEEAAKVTYSLLNPDMYKGRKVLVVGGGDSAIEAACTLASDTNAEVTLSYRRKVISRAKPENRQRLDEMLAQKRIQAIWESEVMAISPGTVKLKLGAAGDQMIEIANDDVLAFIGGELPEKLLKQAGIHFERHFSEEQAIPNESSAALFRRISNQAKAKGLLDLHKSSHQADSWLSWLLLGLGICLIGGQLGIAWSYYAPWLTGVKLDLTATAVFAPAGIWGQTVGVMALTFMLFNFIYLIRKELTLMKGVGNIHNWLNLHVFSGLMSGIFALFHSSLYAKNLFALTLYLSLGIVIFTGLIGRYFFSFVPLDPRGRPLAHAALKSLSERMSKDYERHFKHVGTIAQIDHVLDAPPLTRASVLAVIPRIFFWWPFRYAQLLWLMRQARREIPDPARCKEFETYCRGMFQLRFQMDYMPQLKRILGVWRGSHAVLAIVLVALITAHVVIGFWVGYRWIF